MSASVWDKIMQSKLNEYKNTRAEVSATFCPYLSVVSIPLPKSVLIRYNNLDLNVVFHVSLGHRSGENFANF